MSTFLRRSLHYHFENYLNEDISEIHSSFWKEENNTICQIDILSAWTNKEIVCFSFFTH